MKITAVILAILILAAGFASYLLFVQAGLPPETAVSSAGAGRFEVFSGESFRAVAGRLEQEGHVRSALYLRLMYQVRGRDRSIKTGVYGIEPGTPAWSVVEQLFDGSIELIKVTVPEGATTTRVAEILSDAGILGDRNAFLDAVENPELPGGHILAGGTLDGYLYPDTYFFESEYPPGRITAHMLDTFFRRLDDIYPAWRDLTPDQLREKVIMASIVEREYRVSDEAPLMASVFYNRLDRRMRLQSCATVVYVLTEELGRPHPNRILFSDLELPSAFNTYENAGLPPAPISQPGQIALDAAFNPEMTEYLYFVVDDPGAGTHRFTSTLTDHNQAREVYLRNFRIN